MLTLDEKIEQQKKKAKEELEKRVKELQKEHVIESILIDNNMWENKKWLLYCYNLYGSKINLNLNPVVYHYQREKYENSTFADVVKLSKIFVPEPLVKIRDGSLSFRPKEYVDSLPEEKKERWTEEIDITPFTIKFSCFQSHTATFEWFSQVENLGRIHVRVEIDLGFSGLRDFCTLYPVYGSKRKPWREDEYITKMVFSINEKMRTIYSLKDDCAMATIEREICWASGSRKTPNDYTVYWIDCYPDQSATLEELLTPFM
jgi:hypothetical protein